ncbi:transposase [Pseudonocardia sp. H11422]|uniref:transposase n=1 Tax=Pseudonocardia sp. H11422 TaxID=2835866 RepID=UPI001BDD7234
MTRRQQRLAEDRLWELIEPLLPLRPLARAPAGRPRIDDRAALERSLLVLHAGCRWRDTCRCSWASAAGIPWGGGCGSGRTPGSGPAAPVGARRAVRGQLLDWFRPASTRCRCGRKGSELTGFPADRGKAAGWKYHVLRDAGGYRCTGCSPWSNTHDSKLFVPLLETNPPVRGRPGRPGTARTNCTPTRATDYRQ